MHNIAGPQPLKTVKSCAAYLLYDAAAAQGMMLRWMWTLCRWPDLAHQTL